MGLFLCARGRKGSTKNADFFAFLQSFDDGFALRRKLRFVCDKAILHRLAVADAFAKGFAVVTAFPDDFTQADGLRGGGGCTRENDNGDDALETHVHLSLLDD